MSNMEGEKLEQSGNISDVVIQRGKREMEFKETLNVLDELVGRAESTQGDLRDSVLLLRETLSKMYETFLAEVRDGDAQGAIGQLETSNEKAENVRKIAVNMESLMDEFTKRVHELQGQVRN